ncbi:hypothetical protein AMTR_s00068p00196240 [Amborella trichopoda]|uniref:YTH domain-containing family protein n=2 Tax=Amborella trichopoda TaxID=13333 RepID=U5D4M4_AMBTC|nr:hypothetical protein AMTR_s00068p00196240 [Amborella trichopoda]
MIQKLKVDTPNHADANATSAKDGSPSDATSCISSSGDATSSMKGSDIDQDSLAAEQGSYYPMNNYYGYYYPGYDGSFGEWDDQGYYLGGEGLELQYPGIQADNGSLMYYMPGYGFNQPGYNPYGPYMPGAVIGIDGQPLGQQLFYAGSMCPQPLSSPGYFPPPLPYGSEVLPVYPWDSPPLFGDGVTPTGFSGGPTAPSPKTNFSANPNPPVAPQSKSNQPAKLGTPLEKGVTAAIDAQSGQGNIVTQSLKHGNKGAQQNSAFQATAVLAKGYFPLPKFPAYSNNGKGGVLYPNSPMNFKQNGRNWASAERFKSRGKGNGFSDFDVLNEQNRGPRTKGISEKSESDGLTGAVKRDQYNLSDFLTKYDSAFFFVIKSYSEDDVHKSIKYNVWASTPNGNKRLDNAYQDAQQKALEKGSKCPVFLFFSVNASGQFCGVAEMMGRVDFNQNMDFWQQDKWNGFFPVKWHVIKDVPNPQFRHIILENNDNKPVTNSRDTQEVKFPQGIEMLNIFKNYSSKTSILDDFAFYENRQKAMEDQKIRLPTHQLEQMQMKPDDGAAQLKGADPKPDTQSMDPVPVNEIKENKVENEAEEGETRE